MNDIYKNIPLLCPICGNDLFETVSEDELESLYKCVDCGHIIKSEELIEENAETIDNGIEEIKRQIISDFEKELKKVFK